MSATDSLALQAPAKINLFLQILGRRADGYHDLHSLVQAVSLYDTLYLEITDRGFTLTSDSDQAPPDPSNLIWRAWDLLRSETQISSGVSIRLTKRIPVGAGLGGGSSDAAAALKGLNRLLKLGISNAQLAKLGARLGSDVPFFFSGGSAIMEGRGEQISDCEPPVDYFVVLVVPNFAISTVDAYAKLRFYLTRFSTKSDINLAASGANFFRTLNRVGNDFEHVVFPQHPELESCLKTLQRAGAQHAALSGSGSAIFALFDQAPDPELTAAITSRYGWQVYGLLPVRLTRE